jgi:hypothetical protein
MNSLGDSCLGGPGVEQGDEPGRVLGIHSRRRKVDFHAVNGETVHRDGPRLERADRRRDDDRELGLSGDVGKLGQCLPECDNARRGVRKLGQSAELDGEERLDVAVLREQADECGVCSCVVSRVIKDRGKDTGS